MTNTNCDDENPFTLHELIDMINDTLPDNFKEVVLPILNTIKIHYNQTIESSHDLESCFCVIDELLPNVLTFSEHALYNFKKDDIHNYIRKFFYDKLA